MHTYVKCMICFVHCIHCCDAMFLFCLIINTSINKTIIKYDSKAAQVVNLEKPDGGVYFGCMECTWLQPLMAYINLYLSPFVILQLPPRVKSLVSQTVSLIFLDTVIQLNISRQTHNEYLRIPSIIRF